MSDCGGLVVGALAFPLALVVLLVAGVTYIALRGAGLACRAALDGIQFVGSHLGPSVRAATEAITSAGSNVVSAIDGAAEWTKTLMDSNTVRDRIRSSVESAYSRMVTQASVVPSATTALAASSPVVMTAAVSATSTPGSGTFETAFPSPQPTAVAQADPGLQHAIEVVARARAVSSVLEGEVPLRLVAEHCSKAALSQASDSLTAAESALRVGDLARATTLAAHAEQMYTTATYDAYQRLVTAERATIAAQVGNTLQDVGYDVRLAHSKQGIAVVGRREAYTLAMVLRPGGRMEFDMAGFEGDGCHAEARALLDGLKRNGVLVSDEDIRWHGRFEGGALIRAARRNGVSLETALAELAPKPTPKRTPETVTDVLADAPVRRQSQLARAQDDFQRARAWMWGNAVGVGGNQR